MFRSLARAWTWLVDGTDEALGWLAGLFARGGLRVDLGEDGGTLVARDGKAVGRLTGSEGSLRLEPPDAARHVAGRSVEVTVPPGWLFRRALEPVAAEGAPFLDAFVQHQIDRVTPWRAQDVFFCVHTAPLRGDPSRLSVEVGVVPRRLPAAALAALQACGPARLTLVAHAAPDGRRFAMPAGGGAPAPSAGRRSILTLALALFILAWPAGTGWMWWSMAVIQDEVDDADRVIDERKAVLAAAARHDRARTESEGALDRLRLARLRVVDLLEAASAALPDSAFVTDLSIDKEHVRLSGISTDPAALVPALEASGRFADATFFDATTRVENGTGDRFHIEMRPRAAPPGPAAP